MIQLLFYFFIFILLEITGLWTVVEERHYFLNINATTEWIEIEEGRVVRVYELFEEFQAREDEIMLMSDDGKHLITLTSTDIYYERMSRVSERRRIGEGNWEVRPVFKLPDEDELDNEYYQLAETQQTGGSDSVKYYFKLKLKFVFF